MDQNANYVPEFYEKMDRLIPKYYDYLRGSVRQVGSAERQIIGISSKNFFSVGNTCRPLRNRFCDRALREFALQTIGEIEKKSPHSQRRYPVHISVRIRIY